MFQNPIQETRSKFEDLGNTVNIKAVNYQSVIPVLVEAMKEQQVQIEALQNKIKALKNK